MRRRVGSFLQSESAECGLVCLANVASFYDPNISLRYLRQQFPGSHRGLTLRQVADFARQLSFNARGLRAEPEHFVGLTKPAILHWGHDHFVVLFKCGRRGCWIQDPAVGQRFVSWPEVDQSFTGVALELWPGEQYRPCAPTARALDWKQLWPMLGRPLRDLTWVFVLSVLLQLMILAGPWHMQWTVDEALLRADMHLVAVLALGFALLAAFKVATHWLRSLVVVKLGHHLSLRLSSHFLTHLLRLPLDWFERRHIGDITSRFGSLAPLRDFLTQGAASAIVDVLMAVFALVIMFLYSPLLAITVFVVHAVLLGVGLMLVSYFKRLSLEQVVAQANEETQLLESLRAIRSVKVYAQESNRYEQWLGLHARTISTSMRAQIAQVNLGTFNRLFASLELVVVIYLAAMLVFEQTLTIGQMFAFVSYRLLFVERQGAFVQQLLVFKTLRVHLDRLGEVWAEPAETHLFDSVPVALPKSEAAEGASLVCHELGYRHPGSAQWLLHNFCLTVAPGEFVAIVGPSGVGKTTLLKLLMGLAQPQEGVIQVDGVSLGPHQLGAYRARIGCVMQGDGLFRGSLIDNLTLGDELDLERLATVCSQTGLQSLIDALPMGLLTHIGDMGAQFSAGQQQRILLARAVYRAPEFLFLDEGTANLDAVSAQQIGEVLVSLRCTRIIVTHDHALARRADRVIQLSAQSHGPLKLDQLSLQSS